MCNTTLDNLQADVVDLVSLQINIAQWNILIRVPVKY